ncbi:MAG: hypothetical protein APF76_13485 [Desulfitibacter sp. BRH_c19]|nr:MAG: hypothetical protein APF76_13485 [Desulfitibacter sp. BRH_c19]
MSTSDETSSHAGQRQIEDVIRRIKGVISCNVVISNEDGKIQEVHILSESNRQPKQMVRDIESAVMAELNIPLDHKKISVAQIKQTTPVSKYSRLIINSVDINGSKNWLSFKVSVKLGEFTFEGQSEGPNSKSNRYRVLAGAACQSIETVLEHKLRFIVEEVSWTNLPSCEIGTVVLSCVSENSIERVVGSCLFSTDKDITIVKAVLDALNRRIDLIM